MPREETLELRWFFVVIRRWAWLIAGCTVLAVAVALFVTSRMPPTYEATTTLLVAPADRGNTSEYTSLMAGERLALTYAQMLKGRSILETAILRLGLDETPEALDKRMRTETVRDTQLVRVTVRDASPARAASIANTIGEVFTDYAKTLEADRYQSDLLGKQAQIEAQRRLIEETQSQIGAASAKQVSDETELTRLQGLLADYRTTSRQLQQDYQSLQLLVVQVKDKVTIVDAPSVRSVGATGPYTASVTLLVDQGTVDPQADYTGILASERLAGTYAQLMTGRSVLEAAIASLGTGQSPDALAAGVSAEPIANTQLLQLQVTGAEKEQTIRLASAIAQVFVDQMETILEKPYTDRLANLQAEIARLAALIDESQAEVQARSAAYLQSKSERAQLEDLLVEYRNDLRLLQEDYDEVRLTSIQAPSTVVITGRAHEPQLPLQSRLLYVVLAGVVAMLVALGTAIFIEYLDDSIRTPEDVRHALGLGTLGMIEQFREEPEKPIVASRPQSPTAEAFRVLATNIRLTRMDEPLRTIVVTSPAPVDGKSVVAANLAIAMAGAGLRVVVVDADLRLPRLHALFGFGREEGLTDALWQEDASRYLKSTGVEGVWILTSGKLPLDPVGVVSSPRMKKVLDGLAQQSDLVIIDCPPVLAVADTTILAAGADGVLLVVRAGHTTRQPARRAVEALGQARTRLLGVVLNAVPLQAERYYRYYRKTEEPTVPDVGLGKMPRLLAWGLPIENGQRHAVQVRQHRLFHRTRS